MKIEEKVFERKKFIPEKLLKYGFCEVGDGYEYKTDFMNGEFQASIFVTKEGKASGKVIDVMNDEEYSRLQAENCSDSYVISVQNAYIELLTSIAESCCKILPIKLSLIFLGQSKVVIRTIKIMVFLDTKTQKNGLL